MQITVLIDGRRHEVTGRVAEMMRWLLQYGEDINVSPQGNVQFSFTGAKLKPSRQLFDNEIEVETQS